MQKYEIVKIINGSIRVFYRRKAFGGGEVGNFKLGCGEKSRKSSSLFVDRVVGQRIERHKVLRLLEDHIVRNIVKIGSRYYRQKVGIPQGSILSTILCAFFHGELDRRHLNRFIQDPKSLLLRFVDDLLFVTPDWSLMDDFIHTVCRGFPDFGAVINLKKASANFSHPLLPTVSAMNTNSFCWCGLEIDTKRLCVRADFGKLFGEAIADTLSIHRVAPLVPAFKSYLKL